MILFLILLLMWVGAGREPITESAFFGWLLFVWCFVPSKPDLQKWMDEHIREKHNPYRS